MMTPTMRMMIINIALLTHYHDVDGVVVNNDDAVNDDDDDDDHHHPNHDDDDFFYSFSQNQHFKS